jgi:hypothetical protein
VLLFIRPNDVELWSFSGEARAPSDRRNIFSGIVDKMTYLGDRNDYRIVLGNELGIRVQTDGKLRFSEGEEVEVRLPVSLCRVILE